MNSEMRWNQYTLTPSILEIHIHMDCTSNADVRWHTPKQCSLFLLYIKLVFLVIVDCAQFQFWEATGRRFCCVHAVPTRGVDLLCGRRPCSLLLQYSHRQTRTYPRGELEQDQRDIIITDLASTCTCMPRTMCISLKQGRGFQLVNVRSTTVLYIAAQKNTAGCVQCSVLWGICPCLLVLCTKEMQQSNLHH